MPTENTDLLRACFDLAAALMWEKDHLTSNEVKAHMAELNEMTDRFVEIASNLESLLEELPDKRKILVSTIKYIQDSQAIPPLRGDYDWFTNCLMTILELLHPHSSIRRSNLVFIQYMQQGINTLKGMAVDDEDLMY